MDLQHVFDSPNFMDEQAELVDQIAERNPELGGWLRHAAEVDENTNIPPPAQRPRGSDGPDLAPGLRQRNHP